MDYIIEDVPSDNEAGPFISILEVGFRPSSILRMPIHTYDLANLDTH